MHPANSADYATRPPLGTSPLRNLRANEPAPTHASPDPPPPALLTFEAAGHMLSLGRGSLYRLVAQGRLQLCKLGRASRLTSASVEALLADVHAGKQIVIRQRTAKERRQATERRKARQGGGQ